MNAVDETLVSVTIRETKNSGATAFTLLIPRIELNSKKETYLQTEGIMTKHKFSTNTNSIVGQLDSYKFVLLKGTADLFYY